MSIQRKVQKQMMHPDWVMFFFYIKLTFLTEDSEEQHRMLY